MAGAATFLYLDEMGALKSKPVNRRAGEIAAACGLDVESPFLGDIYVGRCCIDPLIHSVSVALAELEAGSPFLAQAPSENVMYAAAMKELETAKEAKQPSGGDGTGGTNAAAGYVWTQTAEDVEITISLPSSVTKTGIWVVIAAAFLRVTLAGGEAAGTSASSSRSARRDDVDGGQGRPRHLRREARGALVGEPRGAHPASS